MGIPETDAPQYTGPIQYYTDAVIDHLTKPRLLGCASRPAFSQNDEVSVVLKIREGPLANILVLGLAELPIMVRIVFPDYRGAEHRVEQPLDPDADALSTLQLELEPVLEGHVGMGARRPCGR